MTAADRLIVALDVERLEEAERLVSRLVPLGVTHFKVGLSLFTQAGPRAVEAVRRGGGKVFLDLKFHDIPNTVGKAVEAATRLGVWMMNVHIQGGTAMIRQALTSRQRVRGSEAAPLLVGVTILTSMAERDLADLGLRKTLKDQVLYLAKLAKSAGLDGIVASAQEANVIRWACGDGFLIVTPGIRRGVKEADLLAGGGGAGRPSDDQQRTATPREAIRAGADYLVVGRPIVESPQPDQMAREILQEIEGR